MSTVVTRSPADVAHHVAATFDGIFATGTGESLLTGAGFVAAPGTLADARWHLAWWLATTGSPRGAQRLATIDDPYTVLACGDTSLALVVGR